MVPLILGNYHIPKLYTSSFGKSPYSSLVRSAFQAKCYSAQPGLAFWVAFKEFKQSCHDVENYIATSRFPDNGSLVYICLHVHKKRKRFPHSGRLIT